MERKQLFNLVNQATSEVLGRTAILQEDLTNVVDVGTELFNANAVDNYVKELINAIGKIIFVARPYTGRVPSVLMDNWEFGSVVEKVTFEMAEATENESWQLENGASYDTNIFYKPKVSVKFFNKATTFEVPISITELQVKESFNNETQLNSFVSGIYTMIENSLMVKTDALVMRTINNFIGETIHEGNSVRDVKLLTMYNELNEGKEGFVELEMAQALRDLDFLKFASYTIKTYIDMMKDMSVLFNMGGKERHTPSDLLHVVLLSDFARASDVYLQSDTYHKELVALPRYEVVTHWQGVGTDLRLENKSRIDIKTSEGNEVNESGIIGVMFDRDALGISQYNRRVRSHYVEKAEFWNNWYKQDARYFNDFNENFVVFRLA